MADEIPMESKLELHEYIMRWHADCMNEAEKREEEQLSVLAEEIFIPMKEALDSKKREKAAEASRQYHEALGPFLERTATRILHDCGSTLSLN
jgi:hypothetical protein